jgi:hypothetical protein
VSSPGTLRAGPLTFCRKHGMLPRLVLGVGVGATLCSFFGVLAEFIVSFGAELVRIVPLLAGLAGP